VDGAIAAYLKTGALPKRVKANTSDLKCDPLAMPEPSATAAKRAAAPLSRAALQKEIAAH
jgi:hypothetical protein